jgi:hypothetical protein
MANKIIFLRIAWMISYQGVTNEDQPIGAGWFVAENNDGGEVLNFLPVRRRMYGYARMQDDRNLNITRLGAAPDALFIDDVTVVFFSKNPVTGGQYIVGWYEHARLYRETQTLNRPGHPWYTCEAKAADAHLLPLNQRIFATPADGPGQTNAWHVMQYRSQKVFLSKFKRFQRDPAGYGKIRIRKGNASGWMKDMEKRKAIEMAAMLATELHFTKLGFTVRYVHRENLGWDMEAVMGTASFRIEVKGTSLPLSCIDLTPNEYRHSAQYSNYRICILERALEKRQARLHICVLDQVNGCWRSDTGNKLAIRPITSARLELANP